MTINSNFYYSDNLNDLNQPTTLFTDPLTQTDLNNVCGFNNNWLQLFTGYTVPLGTKPAWVKWQFNAALGGGMTQFGLQPKPAGQVSPDYNIYTALTPIPPLDVMYYAQKQFCQVTVISPGSAAEDWGLMGFFSFESLDGSGQGFSSCYYLSFFNSPTQVQVTRYTPVDGLVGLGGFISVPTASVLRMSCDSSILGQTTITATVNGTPTAFVDSSANRLNHGLMGFWDTDPGLGVFPGFQNFSCGLGL